MDGGGRKLRPMTGERDRVLKRKARPDLRPSWLPRRAGSIGTLAFLAAWGWYGVVLGGHAGAVGNAVAQAAGFSIDQVRITGQKETDEIDVLAALEIPPESSLFSYDIASARKRVAEIPWVDHISILKLYPDTLQVSITEREPFALWQRGQVVSIIDREGNVIDDNVAPRFARLPMIVGHGGQRLAAEFVELLDRFPTLKPRVQASVLIANRRWNLVLDNSVEIRLPEKGMESALEELVRLDLKDALLSRDISAVDLRLADRIVVRLSDDAAVRRETILKRRMEAASEADT